MKTLFVLAAATAAFAVFAAENVSTPKKATPSQGIMPKAVEPPPPFRSPEAMQAEFVRRFEASPGFGLSRVARPVFLAPTPSLVYRGTTYNVRPPELVALEDEPVVYAAHEHGAFGRGITNQVSRREIAKHFKPRPLTAAETNVVIAMRAGQDLVIINSRAGRPESEFEFLTPPSLLIYGALRAGKTCTACHQCDPGTLLGAFAYHLTPGSSAAGTPTSSVPLPALTNLVAQLAGR